MLIDDHNIALAGAIVAAMVGIGLGAECKPDRVVPPATLGPRLDVSQTAILTPNPLPAQTPPS